MGVDVFVSYARSDMSLVEPYIKQLRSFDLDIFVDIDDIGPGDEFPQKLANNVVNSKTVLAFWTPLYHTRDWCRRESQLARNLGKLIPAALSPLNPFDLKEFVDCSYEYVGDYNGTGKHFGWSQILKALATHFETWCENNPESPETDIALQKAASLRRTALSVRPSANEINAVGYPPAAIAWEKLDKSDLGQVRAFAESFPGTVQAYEARTMLSQRGLGADTKRAADATGKVWKVMYDSNDKSVVKATLGTAMIGAMLLGARSLKKKEQ